MIDVDIARWSGFAMLSSLCGRVFAMWSLLCGHRVETANPDSFEQSAPATKWKHLVGRRNGGTKL